ncbi:hypothetical protein BH18THE2_BH18THE2_37930 [soil metagenome]
MSVITYNYNPSEDNEPRMLIERDYKRETEIEEQLRKIETRIRLRETNWCKHCQRSLRLLSKTKKEWICDHCNTVSIESEPEPNKSKANKSKKAGIMK